MRESIRFGDILHIERFDYYVDEPVDYIDFHSKYVYFIAKKCKDSFRFELLISLRQRNFLIVLGINWPYNKCELKFSYLGYYLPELVVER